MSNLTVSVSKNDILNKIELVMNVKFSEEQKKAIYSNGKPLNILSCAGSGKSTTLIGKMLFMEMYHNISPVNVLAITFNKEAIADLEGRYYKARLGLGLESKKKITFKTYHALYLLLLKSKFTDIDWSSIGDYYKYIKKLEGVVRKQFKHYDEDTLEKVMSIRGYQVNNMLSYEDLKKTPKFLVSDIEFDGYVAVNEAYEKFKIEDNRIDFEDLQLKMHAELLENEELVKKIHDTWEYILIDEYQDISKVQLDILKIMLKDTNKLIAIGDDDQSIYEFRGSKTDYIVDFGIHFPGAERVIMDVSYRVPENILKPVVHSINNNKKRVSKSIKSSNKGGNLNYLMTKGSAESAILVREKIAQIKNNGDSLNDVVILIRNNSQQRFVMDALLDANIPVKTNSKYSLENHFIIRDIEDIVKLALNEYDEVLFSKLYKKITKFVSGKLVKDVVDKMKRNNTSWREEMLMMDNPSVHEASSMLYAVQALVEKKQPFEKVVNEIQKLYREFLKFLVSRGVDKNELGDFISYLKEVGKEKPYEKVYSDFKRNVQLKDYFSVSGDDCVTISTMHRMKGLEYKYVFLLDLTENVLPNAKIEEEISLKYGAKHAEDYVEQERRLFYVAWTRAKKDLFVLVNDKNSSRFILETIQGIRSEIK